MSRSQGSSNKKEIEKKRLEKKKGKEEKKMERQANKQKGKNLEDMMAYIDENGNISSTPPDPNKKFVINTEDIVIGVQRQQPGEQQDLLRKGIVTFFNDSKGYGFIKDQQTQESIFVHAKGLNEVITDNDRVTFRVEQGPKGPNAVNVSVIR